MELKAYLDHGTNIKNSSKSCR